MYDNAFAGVAFHALGGVAQGTFYAPLKKARNWAWESAWLVQGVAAWVITPWLVAQLCGSHPWQTLAQSSAPILLRTFLFGMVWGAGSLTFGLSVRYLGMSLGMAVALGYTVALGTLVPPVLKGRMTELLETRGGRLVLLGVSICLLGIALCGWAGIRRERAQAGQVSSVRPRLLVGFLIATFSGVMSSGFAFGIQSAQPIAKVALANGAPVILQNSPGFVVVMAGGFLVNAVWCLFLSLRNGSIGDWIGRRRVKAQGWGAATNTDVDTGNALVANYGWAAVAGVTWYLGFMFYGIGTTFMGRYDFTSWSIHLAFVIVFSTLWGIASGEWRGVGRSTRWLLAGAIVILVSSTLVIAVGGRISSQAAARSMSPASKPVVEEERSIPGAKGAPDARVRLSNAGASNARIPANIHKHDGAIAGRAVEDVPELQRMAAHHYCVMVTVDYHLAPEMHCLGAQDDNYAALKGLRSSSDSLSLDSSRIAVLIYPPVGRPHGKHQISPMSPWGIYLDTRRRSLGLVASGFRMRPWVRRFQAINTRADGVSISGPQRAV